MLRSGAIHVFEFGKIEREFEVHTELERWLRFLREGKKLDPTILPAYMQTVEMRQAMATLVEFSEKEKLYHLYQTRKDVERRENDYLQTIEEQTQRADTQTQRADAAEHERDAAEHERDAQTQRAEALRAMVLSLGGDPDAL